ncbi:MAG: hypothetical protein PHW13_02620 [Methylococcales bacterium]|nr:hypothetical protein [Methylococcales bacterium]
MLFSGYRWRLIRLLGILFASGCLLSAPVAAQSPEYAPPPPTPNVSVGQSRINPVPVAQTLIPEGVYAQRLLAALMPGSAQDEGHAEDLLSSLGIEPQYGWISEYPVTPEILGELDKDIAHACGQGKIGLAADQALKLVADLKTALGFNISPIPPAVQQSAGSGRIYHYIDSNGAENYTDDFNAIPPAYRAQAEIVSQGVAATAPTAAVTAPLPFTPQYAASPDSDTINGYYQDQGPPVVTYFPPPQSYYYLYTWVPYGFWSAGYYFPGYFVLNDFRRQIIYNRQAYWVGHHAGPGNGGAGGHPEQDDRRHDGYASPAARNGGNTMIGQEQNRPVAGRAQPQRMPERPVSPVEHYQPPAGGRTFIAAPPRINQPAYQPERFNAPPVFQEQPQQRRLNPGPAFRGGESGGGFGGHESGGIKGGRR